MKKTTKKIMIWISPVIITIIIHAIIGNRLPAFYIWAPVIFLYVSIVFCTILVFIAAVAFSTIATLIKNKK